jgi:hypothetical protein
VSIRITEYNENATVIDQHFVIPRLAAVVIKQLNHAWKVLLALCRQVLVHTLPRRTKVRQLFEDATA